MTYPEATVLIDEMLDKLSGIFDNFGIPPDDLKEVNVERDGVNALITFLAGDTVIDGVTLATTSGVMLRRGENRIPETILDGDLVHVFRGSEISDYRVTPYVDEGLIPGNTYYYRFFPFTPRDVYNFHGNTLSVTIPEG